MNATAIALLKAMQEGHSDPKELMNIVNLEKTQFYDLVKELAGQDYIEKTDSTVQFKPNSKTILFRDVAGKYNIEKLLHDSNEIVFYNLTEPKTLEEIQRTTDLSLRTVERAVSELESIGVIRRSENNTIQLDQSKEQVYLLAKYLKTEYERKRIEEYAEVIYQNPLAVLKRVPKGRRAEGELTGFSLFTDYGIEYHTTHDYYVKQETPLTLGEVLIHAVIAASKDKDKNAMTVTILFYLKNRDDMNSLEIRSVARRYGVIDIWLDIESFVRGNEIKNVEFFSPREEFVEKAQLYEIPQDLYTLPAAYPQLFDDIGAKLPNEISVYLIGGENMRLKGLKARTKDCDIVVSGEEDFRSIVEALRKMGYKSLNESSLSEDDRRLHASDILVHTARSRIDIFNTVVGDLLYISNRMKERAKKEKHGKLELGILQNEDIFILKGVAGREGDIDDMSKLAQTDNFLWDIIWNELVKQEHETGKDFSTEILLTFDYMRERTNIKPPFLTLLLRRVVDKQIFRLIRKGQVSLKDAIESIKFDDIPEKMIRNRIEYLEKKGYLKKVKGRNDDVLLAPGERGVLSEAGIPSNILPTTYEDAVKSIKEISTKIGAPEKTKKKALEIIDKLNQQVMLGGRNPRALAAAAIYLAAIMTGAYDIGNAKEISNAAKINPVSLYANYKRLKIHLRL